MEALVIHRDVETMDALHVCKKEEEEPWMEGKDELRAVFLEEDFICSMLLMDQGVSDSPTGGFESTPILDCSVLSSQMADPLGRCNKEANILLGPVLQVHSPPHTNMKEMDNGEPASNGPAYPPSFKDYIGVDEPSD